MRPLRPKCSVENDPILILYPSAFHQNLAISLSFTNQIQLFQKISLFHFKPFQASFSMTRCSARILPNCSWKIQTEPHKPERPKTLIFLRFSHHFPAKCVKIIELSSILWPHGILVRIQRIQRIRRIRRKRDTASRTDPGFPTPGSRMTVVSYKTPSNKTCRGMTDPDMSYHNMP